jgi:hypothetical protein
VLFGLSKTTHLTNVDFLYICHVIIRRKRGQPKLLKDRCEVCGFDNPGALNVHHIIPRCDPRCSNNNDNLSVLCHTCHDLVHVGDIILLGVYPSTANGGRTLMWHRRGEVPPLDVEDWRVKDNPLVIRRGHV